jgi:hypothetical protein
MSDLFEALLVGAVLASIFTIGWVTAHSEVVTECERLGAFYVGDKTFKCERVKP